MRKTNIIGLVAFVFMVALTVSTGTENQGASYIALGGLIILGACGIIYSLWRVQRMSGVSWKESGDRARELLRRAEDGDLPDQYEETRRIYYPEAYLDQGYYEDE